MKHALKTLAESITSLVANSYLYFDSPITIKPTPHTLPVNIWAVCVSPKGDIYLMDQHEQWEKLEETDRNFPLIVSSLQQRIGLILHQSTRRKAV